MLQAATLYNIAYTLKRCYLHRFSYKRRAPGKIILGCPVNFRRLRGVKYCVKRLKSKLSAAVCLVVCAAVAVAVAAMYPRGKTTQAQRPRIMLTLWQIDSFEGGKGSRADYLNGVGKQYSEIYGDYVTVVSLSADAARKNIEREVVPDMISYGAGAYGLESRFTANPAYTQWCRGGYCFFTLDGDFSDISTSNTVINAGKDNLVDCAAVLCGVRGAQKQSPTAAYLSLLNGEFKYLLGTQRDFYRLSARQAQFSLLPVTQFNDLYQNISVTAEDKDKIAACSRFISFLISQSPNTSALGLMYDGKTVFGNDLDKMQNIKFDCCLRSPVSLQTHERLLDIISGGDVNMLKNFLKDDMIEV